MRNQPPRASAGRKQLQLVTRPELSARCGPRDQHRGWIAFGSGGVFLQGTDDSASAVVAGSPMQRVEMRFLKNRRELHIACSCTTGLTEFCEHIWATLLAAAESNVLVAVHRIDRGALRVVQCSSTKGNSIIAAISAAVPITIPAAIPAVANPGDMPSDAWAQPSPFENVSPWQRIDNLLTNRMRRSAGRETSDSAQPLHLALDRRKHSETHLSGRIGHIVGNQLIGEVLSYSSLVSVSDPVDVELCAIALRSAAEARSLASAGPDNPSICAAYVHIKQHESLLQRLGQLQRLHILTNDGKVKPLSFSARPWRLRVKISSPATVHREPAAPEHAPGPLLSYALTGVIERGEIRLPLWHADILSPEGAVLHEDELAPLHAGDEEWIRALAMNGPEPMLLPPDALEQFIERFINQPDAPNLDLPPTLQLEQVTVAPERLLNIGAPEGGRQGLPVDVMMSYCGREVPLGTPGEQVVDLVNRRIYRRDTAFEAQATDTLRALNFQPPRSFNGGPIENPIWRIPARHVCDVVPPLIDRGWQVTAERQRYQRICSFDFEISSGIQWLELAGTVRLDHGELPVGEVIRALRRKERQGRMIELGDGSVGILPEKWMNAWESLAQVAAPGGNGDGPVQIPRAHVGTLLSLADSADHTTVDDAFARLRDALGELRLPTAARPSRAFQGTLREYQAKGLGWLRFLEKLGFGGCLADDMGLGKTVQILALLAGRAKRHGPSVVIAPRSVLDNWSEETARFVPSLPVQMHIGPGRAGTVEELQQPQLIVTSHALLIRDLDLLSKVDFDYIILDEAQSIKNGTTATARAARALRAKNRVALTGTPIENHLGELWSILEFTNPGLGRRMPGRVSARSSQPDSSQLDSSQPDSSQPDFSQPDSGQPDSGQPDSGQPDSSPGGSGAAGTTATDPDLLEASYLAQVRTIVKPFLLRRTKQEVAPELPPRIEQTLTVELEPWEMQPYVELHAHYRERVNNAMVQLGIRRSTPRILEALLRLRQAACHPGLIDETYRKSVSSKTAMLLERLREIREEGNRALVFSQFTAHLDLVEYQLKEEGFCFERLDGSTQNRGDRVKRFQNDSSVTVFLISLKAGGTGLNLTAADYVFLLDPWWNPAAEAQAIDRAHRIGRDRPVVAYRLIAKGTVEEKVVELQIRKRRLANQILGDDDAALVGRLTREDLMNLLEPEELLAERI